MSTASGTLDQAAPSLHPHAHVKPSSRWLTEAGSSPADGHPTSAYTGAATVSAQIRTTHSTGQAIVPGIGGHDHRPLLPAAGESDFGSKMGATIRGPARLGAVSVTASGVLSRVDTSYQPACTCACAVRDEEAAGSNPATPTS